MMLLPDCYVTGSMFLTQNTWDQKGFALLDIHVHNKASKKYDLNTKFINVSFTPFSHTWKQFCKILQCT